jgi:hypothetical protein
MHNYCNIISLSSTSIFLIMATVIVCAILRVYSQEDAFCRKVEGVA